MNRRGDSVAVWSVQREDGGMALLASFGRSVLGEGRSLPGVSGFQPASVGIDGRGRALAVWTDSGLPSGRGVGRQAPELLERSARPGAGRCLVRSVGCEGRRRRRPAAGGGVARLHEGRRRVHRAEWREAPRVIVRRRTTTDLDGFRAARRARAGLAVGFHPDRRASVAVRVRRSGQRSVLRAASRLRLAPGAHEMVLAGVPDGRYDVEIVARDGRGGQVRGVEDVSLAGPGPQASAKPG